jgi:mRNA-degrading endonuclease RelE of RelBE toxin-antitoxin system
VKPSSKPYKIRISKTASTVIEKASDKDRNLIKEAIRIIALNPFDSAHVRKLKGEWEGHFRIRKGDWRIIFRPPEDNVIYIVYIRKRSQRTY